MLPFLSRFRPMGIRAQLMLWYSLVFSVMLFICGMIFYLNFQAQLVSNLDTTLSLRARGIAAAITEQNGVITIHDSTGELSGLIDGDDTGNPGAILANDKNYKDPNFDVDLDALVRVLANNKAVAYTTPAFHALSVPKDSVSQPQRGTPWLGTVAAHNGQMVRLYAVTLRDENNQIFGVLQIGTSMTLLNTTSRSIIFDLLVLAPLIFVLGVFGSYWVTHRALIPIKRVTSTARTIKAGNLQLRVPLPGTRDEVQHLALTFNEMLESLAKTFALQRRFMADASHELRTPVAAIRSMTDVALAQGISPEESSIMLRDINTQAEHLGHLIGDLLTLSRADEGHVHFEEEQVRLDLLASDVAATMEWLAVERGITLEIQTVQPALVIGDEARLIQVVMNLLGNALNYTKSGGQVTLKTTVTQSNAQLSISDTGIGIAPEHIEHVFERFYRGDGARSRTVDSTGLGLSIVDWVVRMHHGTISLQSQLGQGSTFTVTLPLAKS